jgi:hypothetical protein
MKPALLLAMVLLPAGAAGADKSKPTTPTNFRVTGVAPYSVSLAWSPSKDNSGTFSYVICCSNTNSATVPQAATTYTYTAGLEQGRSYTLRIYARDAAGNYSNASNAVTFTLPADTIPPTKPLLSVTDVGPTYAALAWSATDNGPNLWYTIFKDGTPIQIATRNTSAIVPFLEPETDYTFTVEARDFAGRRSPLSDPALARTEARNSDDITPPSTPGNFGQNNWGDCEVELTWDESTDDVDPQWIIEYQIFVNDVYDHSTSLRYHRTIVYGNRNGANTFMVVAVDQAGNRSDPAEVTADLICGQ